MALLQLSRLCKAYDGQPAVAEISLELERGQILCLLGPSGCGKTTLLRLTAGLESPDRGRIVFGGRDLTPMPAHERRFGLMFQEFALFPHKSVFDNVAFGLSLQSLAPKALAARTEAMLKLVGMADFARRSVADLSGGERQRVALARSLAPRPRLLMLDEPLGALDRALRERLLGKIRQILKDVAMTAIFVTHDQSEALAVADRIAVMNAGRLEQMADPETLYRQPQSRFAARFLGFRNLIEGQIGPAGNVRTALGEFGPLAAVQRPGERVTLILRPEGARLAAGPTVKEEKTNPPGATLRGRVISRLFTGQTYRVKIKTSGDIPLTFDLPNRRPPPPAGRSIELVLDPASWVVIPEER